MEVSEGALQEFCLKWELDTKARWLLRRLPPALQMRVMSGFAPQDRSRASALFMGFARSVERKHGGKGNNGKGLTVRPEDAVEAFVFEWALDPEAARVLNDLPPHLQEKAITEFSPPENCTNKSACFISYARSLKNSRPRPADSNLVKDPTLESFIFRWGLDRQASNFLHNMDALGQQRVIAEFAPSDVSQGASKAFMTFAKRFSQLGADNNASGRKCGYGDVGARQNDLAVGQEAARTSTTGAEDTVLWAAQWGLDEEAQFVLDGLDPDTQQWVMRTFAPRDLSQGASAAFIAFVAVLSRSGMHYLANACKEADHRKSFVAKWQLDANAQSIFMGLEPDVQQKVMSSFQPTDFSQGASAAFTSLVHSITCDTSQAAGTQPHEVTQPGVWERRKDMLEVLTRWQLDAKVHSALLGLEPDAQQRVINLFDSKYMSGDVSCASVGLVRGIAAGDRRSSPY